jgi:hypothetical protein
LYSHSLSSIWLFYCAEYAAAPYMTYSCGWTGWVGYYYNTWNYYGGNAVLAGVYAIYE